MFTYSVLLYGRKKNVIDTGNMKAIAKLFRQARI